MDDLTDGIRVHYENGVETYQRVGGEVVSTFPWSSDVVSEVRYDVVPFVSAYQNVENGVVYAPSVEIVDYGRANLPTVTAGWSGTLDVTYRSDGERLAVTNEYNVKRSFDLSLGDCSYRVHEIYIVRGAQNSWDRDTQLIWYFPDLQIAPLVDDGLPGQILTAAPVTISAVR